jgi:hypothetical protein
MRSKQKERAQQEFAARFRKALDNMGYFPSQQALLGRLFGVSGQAVRKWATGEALPHSSRMPYITSVLGVRRAWLQDGEEPMMPEVARIAEGRRGDEISISSDEAKILYHFRLLTPRQQDTVRNTIFLFAEKNKD